MGTITALLLYFIFPIWTVVGVGDYLSHRATRIERTSGVGESAFHLVQLVQVGLPLLAALLLDLTASVLLFIAVAAILHTVTAWWDVAYSEQNRWEAFSA